jgi:hypothetical protein
MNSVEEGNPNFKFILMYLLTIIGVVEIIYIEMNIVRMLLDEIATKESFARTR